MISIASKEEVFEFIRWVRHVKGQVVFGKFVVDFFDECPVSEATGVRVYYADHHTKTFEVAPWCIASLRFQLDANGRPI